MQHRTQACLYFGRAIASEDFLQSNPRGFQDALTDPAGNKWFFINVALLIAMLIFYFSISWVFLVIGIVNIFLMMVLVRLFLPKVSSEKYLLKIVKSLNSRAEDLDKKGDSFRSSLLRELIDKLENYKINRK